MANKAWVVLEAIRLSARRISAVVVVVGSLACHAPANAIPIGDFSWNEYSPAACDSDGTCGAYFSVDNFSTDPTVSLGPLGDTFFGVTVNLLTDTGLRSLSLGDIAPFGSSQSFDDLAGAIISSAALTFTFGSPQLPGSLELLDAAGNIVTSLTASLGSVEIDYVAPVASVPEPSTLLLLAGGLLGVARYRRPKQNRSAAQDPGRPRAR